ncbi:MAG: hypothetical protein IJ089_03895 [Clostridia bacterium]|nr:hypothetical protein [Clostridia bacterium]
MKRRSFKARWYERALSQIRRTLPEIVRGLWFAAVMLLMPVIAAVMAG